MAKESQAQALLDASPGFRAPPRTRHGIAAAEAFEAEAQGGGEIGEHEQEFGVDTPEEHARREAAKQKPAARRRVSIVLPGYADIPPIVEEVDNRQSFKMFNDGWILPENSKRGNRSAAVERAPPPPPKKKPKKSERLVYILIDVFNLKSHEDRDTSGLSMLNSSATDNQTLQLLADAAASESRVIEQGSIQHDMEVDIPRLQDSNMSSPLSDLDSNPERATSSTKPISTISTAAAPTFVRTVDGKIIVETLDTPALRKQKSIMRKAERERLASLSAQGGSSQLMGDPETNILHTSESQSDPQGRSVSRAAASVPPRDPAIVVLEDGQTLDGGTLVWAKARK